MRFKKASLGIKIGILVILVSLSIYMVYLQKQINEVYNTIKELQSESTAIEMDSDKLKADIDGVQAYFDEKNSKEAADETFDESEIIASIDSDAMEELAREQGYVEPDEIVFEDVNN